MGGVYRDQGLDAVSNWLMPLLRPYVEVTYCNMREEHFLSETVVPPQLGAPTVYTRSPVSSTLSEGRVLGSPSYLSGFPNNPRRPTAPLASVSQQSSAQAGEGVGTHPDIPRARRRRRRRDAGEQGKFYLR